jgi:hypothetical protein
MINEARGTEAGSQQTYRMEVLKPLAVGHVGLSAGNILYVLRVASLKTSLNTLVSPI